ncbi:AMP-dependent synthetase/ligase [Salinibacter altiplanensis]|uniref:AMP-dependent synthetase/ligase n=1 Tax=Salinibacter altiplanensis TaxID=1803181 RepID=UPI000C9F23A8|nr:long-chain fatty acid--CoA ligase [Salinibacter altiplanensis]
MSGPIHAAPPDAGPCVRGRTIPDLLYEATDAYENPQALNQPTEEGWVPMSLDRFRQRAEETALGLRALGLNRGTKVALLLESDVHYCVVDMGCLIGGLIDVPLYLSSAPEQMQYVVDHAGAEVLVVSNPKRLDQAAAWLPNLPRIETVIVCDPGPEADRPDLPDRVTVKTLGAVQELGRSEVEDPSAVIAGLRAELDPHDLATIIYTSGTTGQPKGVMLSHENISSNAITSIAEIDDFETGPEGEVALSFLPLTHVFARMLQYAYMMRGISIYFVHPDDLVDALPKVRPTVFASVPRVLEKVYAGIKKKIMGMQGLQKRIGEWGLQVAQAYDTTQSMSPLYALKHAAADRLVFRKWRAAFGGRVKYIVVGGAALQSDLANLLAAADVTTVQGYGLTETSPVISYTRPQRNKPGTVGEPLPGVEVKIAEDGEILTRGPHVMQGYYKAPDETDAVMEEDGWLRTGDIGEFDADGFLKITDRKKALFKLSTGKYVMPQPMENRMGSDPLVDNAVVVGSDRKFCAALLFPAQDQVRALADERGLGAERDIEDLLIEPHIVDAYRSITQGANDGMEPWSTVKRLALIPDELTVESDLMTPTMKIRRPKVRTAYADEIEALYDDDGRTGQWADEGTVLAEV